MIPSLLDLTGTLSFLYPSISAWVVQYSQSQLIVDYEGEIKYADSSASEQFELAARYNDALNVEAVLKANIDVLTGEGTSDD